MSKIPGFQGNSKLKAPGFKSRLAAPGSFGFQPSATTKNADNAPQNLQGQDGAAKVEKSDVPERQFIKTAPKCVKQDETESSKGTSNVKGMGVIKDVKGYGSQVQTIKQGMVLPQSRLAPGAGKVSNLHSQTPYSRETENKSKGGNKKLAGPAFGLRKPVSRTSKPTESSQKALPEQTTTKNESASSKSVAPPHNGFKEVTPKGNRTIVPPSGKLSKKTSTSLHNLSSNSASKQGSRALPTPMARTLNASKSMLNLSPSASKERASDASKQPSKLRKFASSENVGKANRPGGRSFSSSSVSYGQGSSNIQPKWAQARSSRSSSTDSEGIELHKPNTLRIPSVRPMGRSLVTPKPVTSSHSALQAMRSNSAASKQLQSQDSSLLVGRRTELNNQKYDESQSVIGRAGKKDTNLGRIEIGSIPEINGPRQSTPVRKEANVEFGGKGDSRHHGAGSLIARPPSFSFSGNAEFKNGTRSITPPSEEHPGTYGLLEQTFDVNEIDKVLMQELEVPQEEEGKEKSHNTTYTQERSTINASMYQLVYSAQDDDVEDDGLHKTFSRSSPNQSSSFMENTNEESSLKRTDSCLTPPKIGNATDASPSNFDIFLVSPPQLDVSFNDSLGDRSLQKPNLKVDENSFEIEGQEELHLSLLKVKQKLAQQDKTQIDCNSLKEAEKSSDIKVEEVEEVPAKPEVEPHDGNENTSSLTKVLDKSEDIGPDLSESVNDMDKTEMEFLNGDDIEFDFKVKSMTLPRTRTRRAFARSDVGSPLSPHQRDWSGKRLNDVSLTGVVLKPPSRNLFMLEDSAGNVVLDKWSYIQLQHEIKAIKTALLKLKRGLQEVDISSSLAKTSMPLHVDRELGRSNSMTRPRMRPKAFSDANNWASRSLDIGPSDTTSVVSKETSNHWDLFSKVNYSEDQEMTDRMEALEKMRDDLLHELEMKDNTIRLLQTQLEGKHHLEEKGELLEQNIILREQVAKLSKKLQTLNTEVKEESLESTQDSSSSLQCNFAKQLDNESPYKAGILRRMYSHE